ncbi:hypothetical protein D9M68_625430 [compost metagenome]
MMSRDACSARDRTTDTNGTPSSASGTGQAAARSRMARNEAAQSPRAASPPVAGSAASTNAVATGSATMPTSAVKCWFTICASPWQCTSVCDGLG